MATGIQYVHEELTLRAPAPNEYEDITIEGVTPPRMDGHEWWCDGLHRLPTPYRGVTCWAAAEIKDVDERMVRYAR